jgi:hypothetical protein
MQYLHSYKDWVDDIKSGNPISFSRWADGELCSVLGSRVNQKNCDGHTFFPEMGRQLEHIITSRPSYRLGFIDLDRLMYAGKTGPKPARQVLAPFLTKHNLYNYPWYSAEVFHRAVIADNLSLLIPAVNQRNVIIVGPDHLKLLEVVNYNHYVAVPNKDCFLAVDSIYKNVVKILDAYKTHNFLVSISASMPSCILVDRLYKSHGKFHSFIDFGAVWDPFVGVLSRAYMRNKVK